jgi:hypothetical protein
MTRENLPVKRMATEETLTPERRRLEIAGILAAGILRLHARAALPSAAGELPGPRNLAESEPARLEVSEENVLSVHSG